MQKLIQMLTMLPALLQAVRAAEDAIPIPKAGQEKLALILGIVDDVAEVTEDIKPIIARIISRIVSLFNSLGLFRTSSA